MFSDSEAGQTQRAITEKEHAVIEAARSLCKDKLRYKGKPDSRPYCSSWTRAERALLSAVGDLNESQ